MNAEKVIKVIELLEKVRLRPYAFLGELSTVNQFLTGIRCACIIFELRINENIYLELMREQGWDFTGAMISFRALKYNFNLTDEEMVRKILDIEILAWKRSYGLL